MPSWLSHFVERDAGYITPCYEWTGARSQGYGIVRIGGRRYRVHRLVWAMVNGDPGSLHVLHRCDNPPCARVTHLFLGTHAVNMRDMADKGRARPSFLRGEAHGRAQLTEADIRAIRIDPATDRVLARQFGVTPQNIRRIRLRKTWRHVKP